MKALSLPVISLVSEHTDAAVVDMYDNYDLPLSEWQAVMDKLSPYCFSSLGAPRIIWPLPPPYYNGHGRGHLLQHLGSGTKCIILNSIFAAHDIGSSIEVWMPSHVTRFNIFFPPIENYGIKHYMLRCYNKSWPYSVSDYSYFASMDEVEFENVSDEARQQFFELAGTPGPRPFPAAHFPAIGGLPSSGWLCELPKYLKFKFMPSLAIENLARLISRPNSMRTEGLFFGSSTALHGGVVTNYQSRLLFTVLDARGYALTSASRLHEVIECGELASTQILSNNFDHDISLVKFHNLSNLSPVSMSLEDPKPFDIVFVVAGPPEKPSRYQGIVADLRQLEERRFLILQMDQDIDCVGAAILNANGALIGVVQYSYIHPFDHWQAPLPEKYEGILYGIPIADALKVV